MDLLYEVIAIIYACALITFIRPCCQALTLSVPTGIMQKFPSPITGEVLRVKQQNSSPRLAQPVSAAQMIDSIFIQKQEWVW